MRSRTMAPDTRRMRRIIAPLSARQAHAAGKTVVERLISGRADHARPPRVLGVELRVDKPARQGDLPQRRIRVVVADYASGRVVDVTVDERYRMVEETHYRGVQPAFVSDEVDEARELVEADPRVAQATARQRFFIESFSPPTTHQRGSRTIGLRYVATRARRGADILAEAVVDLDHRTVTAVAVRRTERPDGGLSGRVR
jgi:hypothetical protein